ARARRRAPLPPAAHRDERDGDRRGGRHGRTSGTGGARRPRPLRRRRLGRRRGPARRRERRERGARGGARGAHAVRGGGGRVSAGAVQLADVFGEHRRFLWGLCYRLTGSAADADDLVQETFVRAIERPPERTDEPWRPWLVRVALNLGRDLLRRRRRRGYVGPWLPSPIETGDEVSPPSVEPVIAPGHTMEGRYDLLESVSYAFLVALEALTPLQRAVLLLRDVFDYTVAETVDALGSSEANVK